MNPRAIVTSVKSATPASRLPSRMADRDRPWNSRAAIARVRTATDSTDEPSGTYRNAFLYVEDGEEDNFGGYKLPIVDVIDGQLTVVPRAVFAARAAMEGARGGVDIPEEDRGAVERTINTLYERMDLDAPFERGQKKAWSLLELESLGVQDCRHAVQFGILSRKAATAIANTLIQHEPTEAQDDPEAIEKMVQSLQGVIDVRTISNSG